ADATSLFRIDEVSITPGVPIDMADETILAAVLQDVALETETIALADTNFTLTFSNGPTYDVDLENWTANRTITLSGGPPSGTHGQMTVRVRQDGTAARTITWAGGTFWWAPDGVAHVQTPTLNGFSIYTFETWDAGANWFASGSDYS
ncbi:MAG: hypothetical protein V3S69_07600, partial [Dehalococcoidales bacterium]